MRIGMERMPHRRKYSKVKRNDSADCGKSENLELWATPWH